MPAWLDLFDMLQPRGAALFSCGVIETWCQRSLAKRPNIPLGDASRVCWEMHSTPEPVLSPFSVPSSLRAV
jgi:hypothetical protein